MIDCYVSDEYPHYQVWVNGEIVDSFTVSRGGPLKWSEQWGIAAGYRQWYETQEALDGA